MDRLAKKMLKTLVTPTIEKMLDDREGHGITDMELARLDKVVDIAKDLLEIDCLYQQLGISDDESGYPHEKKTTSTMNL